MAHTIAGEMSVTGWRSAVALLIVGGAVAACGGSDEAESTCQPPPAAEIEAPSLITMTLDPNPATAGMMATLWVSDAGLPAGAFIGLDVIWQCWDGSQWVDTYQLVRAVDPFTAQAIRLEPGVTTTIAALGVPLPSTAVILIPDVPPGIYRLADQAIQPGPQYIPGHLIVEVVEG